VLLVDKPVGPTSHDVVDEVRRVFGERRVGHAGTLDPFASGLLLMCVGPATRLAEFLSGLDKEYLTTFRLGRSTATHDPEGATLSESDAWQGLTTQALEAVSAALQGTYDQVPPRFSAKKLAGEPAHRRARRGEEVHLDAVPVTVHAVDLLEISLPEITLRITCSSGTYVRALARDMGDALGVGAFVSRLRRTRVGRFDVADASPLDSVGDLSKKPRAWLAPAAALAHLPTIAVDEPQASRLAHGQDIETTLVGIEPGEPVLVLHGGELVAVGVARGGRLAPRKVFVVGSGS
jgi:tRNA pseudouridine55 synthase